MSATTTSSKKNHHHQGQGVFVCLGCGCSYTAVDCRHTPLCGTKYSRDFLCIRWSGCCALNAKSKGCGFTTNRPRGEYCKLGLVCCDYSVIRPTKCCATAEQTCCCSTVSSCPTSVEFLPCTVAVFPINLLPVAGCCLPPPPCPALDKVLRDGSVVGSQRMEERDD